MAPINQLIGFRESCAGGGGAGGGGGGGGRCMVVGIDGGK